MAKTKEMNLVDATTLTTSKTTGLIFCPSWTVTFISARLLSAFSQRLLLFLFILVFGLGQTEAGFIMYRTAQKNISNGAPAFNLGILIDQSTRNSFEADCTDDIQAHSLVYPMVAEHMREDLLANYNVDVGFYAIDTCGSPNAAMYQAFAFLPNSLVGCKARQSYSDVLSSISVYGVVSTLRPTHTSPAFAALNAAGVPSISVYGSEKLSDRKKYPNLYHILPNEDAEVKIIPLLLKDNAWYYVSVVHEDSLVFSRTFQKLKAELELVCKLNASQCLCIATVQTLTWDASDYTADEVVNELVKQKDVGANVVVVIASFPVVLKLLNAVNRHSPLVQFVWIATQSWVWRFFDLAQPQFCAHLLNTLVIFPWKAPAPVYLCNPILFIQTLPSKLSTNGSWYRVTLQRHLCKDLNPDQCTEEVKRWPSRVNFITAGTFMTAYKKLSKAIRKAIISCGTHSSEANCIRAKTRGFLAEDEELTNLQKQANHPVWSVLDVRNQFEPQTVGSYFVINNTYTRGNTFTLLTEIEGSGKLPRVFPCLDGNWNATFEQKPVFSGCRPVCKPQEKYVAQKPKECCWRCVKCRHYEIVTENRTGCEMCPETKWPDNTTNFTTCYSLPVFRPTFSDYWPKRLVTLAVCLITLNLGVFAFFLWNRKERVIKATSLQLSVMMQLGLIMGSASIIVSCAPASQLTCPLSNVLHDLSSSLLLCPLFMRTLLIFRIFRQKRRVTVSMRRWVMLCVLLAVVKPILSLMEWPCPKTSQPDRYETYVELHCDIRYFLESAKREIQHDMSHIVHGLKTAYSSLITLLCLGLAFQLRHLPNNFNESGFICMCITAEITSMILISSGASILKRNLQKMYFFLFGYVLNLLLYLIILFFTKIYAVMFVVRYRGHGTTVDFKETTVIRVRSARSVGLKKIEDSEKNFAQVFSFDEATIDIAQQSVAHTFDITDITAKDNIEQQSVAQTFDITDITAKDNIEQQSVAQTLDTDSDTSGSSVDETNESAELMPGQAPGKKKLTDEGSEKLNLDTLSTLARDYEILTSGAEVLKEFPDPDTISPLASAKEFTEKKLDPDTISTLASAKEVTDKELDPHTISPLASGVEVLKEIRDEVSEKRNIDLISTLASVKEFTDEESEKLNLDTISTLASVKEIPDEVSEKLNLDTISTLASVKEIPDEVSEKLKLDTTSTLANVKEFTDKVSEKLDLDFIPTLESGVEVLTELTDEVSEILNQSLTTPSTHSNQRSPLARGKEFLETFKNRGFAKPSLSNQSIFIEEEYATLRQAVMSIDSDTNTFPGSSNV